MKIFVVGPYKNYANWIQNGELVEDIKDAELVIFTGGADVHPKLYGERKLACTSVDSTRDVSEVEAFNKVTKLVKKGKKIICLGICRGAQLLCALNGGKVIQDVSGHAIYGTHPITDGNITLEITSLHHQMMYPFKMNKSEYDILFRTAGSLSHHYEGSYVKIDEMCDDETHEIIEPEVVLFHVSGLPKCLAIQGHPEMMRDKAPAVEYFNTYIRSLIA